VKAREVLELIRVEQLSPEALAQVRSKAWKLEQSAQRHSKEVYARTKPAMLANAAPTAR
jgi:hypothetical protein